MVDSQTPRSLPRLLVPRAKAERDIKAQIEKGLKIRNQSITSTEEVDKAELQLDKWANYNFELLARSFDSNSIADESRPSKGRIKGLMGFTVDVQAFRSDVDDHVNRLESILERLPLIPESVQSAYPNIKTPLGKDVFIVHGHDEAAKESVARLIEKLGLHAIILHEQPNAGRTVIEKFEGFSNVGFAVVLLTPDDIGADKDKRDELKPRARQNVILELGYFTGKLGRGRVCALYKEGVEIPSDYQGVLYIPMDDAGGWRMSLAKEIKQAGIEVDLNRI